MQLNNKSFIYNSFYVICFMFLITFMCFSFKEDEEVTMGFMNHSFRDIIRINSLDVHPPLYYMLLKLFLSITTFWTHSIFIKTILARLFSFIIFLLLFHILEKIVLISGASVKFSNQFLFYCFMPSILEVATHIRMYELATLFVAIEYYKLISFFKKNRNIDLFDAVIYALLAAYTQYFVAIIASVLLFLFFVKEYIIKRYFKCIKIIGFYLLFLVLYIPIFPYVIKQLINRSKFPSANTGVFDQTLSSLVQLTSSGNKIKEIFDILLFVSLLIFSFILIEHSYNNCLDERLYEVGFCVLLSIFIELIISLVYSPFFECRFLFPLVSIYFFFVVSMFLNEFALGAHYKKLFISLFSFVVILIMLADVQKCRQNIIQYDVPSIQLLNNFNKYKNVSNRNIDVSISHFPTQNGEALYATQYSVYLKSINKNAVVYDSDNNIYEECNGNRKFVHKLFANLYIK